MWKEVTNGIPLISILHHLVNLYLFKIKQQKGSAHKTAETHQVQIQHTLSDTLQMFYFCSEKWWACFPSSQSWFRALYTWESERETLYQKEKKLNLFY